MFRVSIRELLFVVTIVAVAAGWFQDRKRLHWSAMIQLREYETVRQKLAITENRLAAARREAEAWEARYNSAEALRKMQWNRSQLTGP